MRWLATILFLLAGPALAQGPEFITAWGKISDEDFYRIVSCAAPQGGGACQKETIRWAPSRAVDLRVRLEPPPRQVNPVQVHLVDLALSDAMTLLNASGARVALRRVAQGDAADIRVFVTAAGDGAPITGTGEQGIDGEIIGAGLTTLWWDGPSAITDAVIVLASDIPPAEVLPVMLEELTQSLGLLTDIRNPLYDAHSVFSEDSNSVTRLGPQDLTALRWHYPPG